MKRSSPPPALGMVLKGYPRISETFISNEILLLEELGYSIHIFSMRKPRESFAHGSVLRIKARVTYLPSTLFTSLHRLLWPNAAVAFRRPREYGRALALAWRRFKRNRKIATLKHVFQAGYLVHRCLHGPDAPCPERFHAHFAHSPASVAMFAAILARGRFSFTAHAKDIYTQHQEQLREKMAAADFVVTCTEYNRRYLQSLAANGTDVSRVYHGINVKLFDGEGEPRPAAPPYAILTVARFVEKKGLDVVLRALAILRDQGLDFRYVLVGGGEEEPQLRRQAKELGLTLRVDFAGSMNHERVLDHYRSADVFVLGCRIASTNDRDGIPNVIAEAMAMSVPVAATDVSGIPELVEHEETGLLCPPEDPAALAASMRRLLEDQDLRRRIIPAALKKVRKDFYNQDHILRLARIYANHGLGPYPGHSPGAP